MSLIHLAALFGLLLFVFCWRRYSARPQDIPCPPFAAPCLFGAALLLRLLCAGLYGGFDADTACFASWADRIFEVGPGGFYSPDVFTDYPPGYMYLLYPVGALRHLLKIPYYSVPHLILLRLPAILCDLGCGLLLYREGVKKTGRPGALLLCAAYLFNPAILLNSSLWGQADSVLTLALIAMTLCLVHGRLGGAYVSFLAALLIKPQALFLAPVLLLGMLDQLMFEGFSLRRTLQSLAMGVSALCGFALAVCPFGLEKAWAQLLSTLSSYPYASVNAYNFWALCGLNWTSQENRFLGVPYYAYGYAALLVAAVCVTAFGIRLRRDREKYPLLGALLVVSVFLFSVRMHERYLYPALLLCLFAFLYKPSHKLFACYGGFSLLHFYNTAHVLFFYDAQNYDGRAPILLLTSLGMVAMGLIFYQTVFSLYKKGAAPIKASDVPSPSPDALPRPSRKARPLGRLDVLCMAAVTLLYSAFALYDLGDRQAPVTTAGLSQGQSLTFDFGDRPPAAMAYYIAPWHDRTFTLEGKQAREDAWAALGEIKLEDVFTWQEVSIQSDVPFLRLTLTDDQAAPIEFVFLDSDGSQILPLNAGDYPALFDEQSLYPQRASYRNSMYFDEIYHGRTAYEFLEGLPAYENTHPPLGKILISAGIALFGMNPFGWRIVGVVFGIAMVPLVYLSAKRLTERRLLAALASVLFAFDFMHLTQTRIATIDVYITFFVILMYWLMYRYAVLSFYDTPLWKTFLPLGACGVCMGLGIACKWTGVYAGIGLAVIFFAVLSRRYREYRYAAKDPEGETAGIPHARILERFWPCVRGTLLFCTVFFAAVPFLIYLLSYLPFLDYTQDGLLLRMLHNQVSMFRYHSTLEATHPYSSPWYQWPVMVRPVWYYSGLPGGSLREGISAFGNPLVWWAGIPAFFFNLYLGWKEKDQKAAFLTVGYLAQYLPWVFVTRITFLYHYFPSVPFVVLMIVYSIGRLGREMPRRKLFALTALYGAAVFGLFLLFFPVLTGQPVEAAFVDRWLRWFDTWVLTAR